MQIKPLFLTVKSRDGIIYNGEVKAVTSNNDRGRFDVLSYHANFISLVRDYIEYISPDNKKKIIPIRNAVMQVVDNFVNVYIGF